MIGGDFDVPIAYQDLANSSMGPMNMQFGAMSGMYGMSGVNTSYLGGIKMGKPLDSDTVHIMSKKENQDKNTLKKVLIILGAVISLGGISILGKNIKKAGGITEYAKSCWNSIKKSFTSNKNKTTGNWFTRLFKKNKS